ncbi:MULTISPECIES: DUF6283 family protein [Amycolatopsis]|uniref:DUF6283 family protein n=1 Tax=Amycolatopsis albidoflavus TaxID=102226 RepID=A0ABW5HRJ5_9PSEU
MSDSSGSSADGDAAEASGSCAAAAPKSEIVAVHEGADGWGVMTFRSRAGDYQREPCAQCPWLIGSPRGAFPPEVFRHSARTAYDLATSTFGCHASPRGEPRMCAGFLLRGAAHNLTVRMYGPGVDEVSSDRSLYDSYRDMAIANGVAPDDPALQRCRHAEIDCIDAEERENPDV